LLFEPAVSLTVVISQRPGFMLPALLAVFAGAAGGALASAAQVAEQTAARTTKATSEWFMVVLRI
jgi:hypothetical protein